VSLLILSALSLSGALSMPGVYTVRRFKIRAVAVLEMSPEVATPGPPSIRMETAHTPVVWL